jgi:hypothetical protein
MPLEFGAAEIERMKEIERAVEKTLMQFNGRGTEAALPIAALLLCARRLIRLYPEPRRSALIQGAEMFLEGENPDQQIVPFSTLIQ